MDEEVIREFEALRELEHIWDDEGVEAEKSVVESTA